MARAPALAWGWTSPLAQGSARRSPPAVKAGKASSSTENALQPALGFLDRIVDGIDGRAYRGNARRAVGWRGALPERQLDRAGAAAIAAQVGLLFDPDFLDALGLRSRERLGAERGHHSPVVRHPRSASR